MNHAQIKNSRIQSWRGWMAYKESQCSGVVIYCTYTTKIVVARKANGTIGIGNGTKLGM